jgi:cytochrome c-type biogenesis protein CcmH
VSARARWVGLLAAAAVVAVVATLARGGGGGGDGVEARVQAIAAELRCPVCQNLSVADSPSPLAREMRAEIEAQIAAGRTDAEIRAFFVERYGDWVLLSPPRRGLNLLPWLVPIGGVLVGAGVWVALARRRPADGTVGAPVDRARIDREVHALGEGDA